ncbi:DUF4436 domain-containing protein [Microbacterium sp. LRZ72]|uniref:DUF4436 family protein n=1 Tax=Microbacterium sp. LRZ72 TaxID=2942481 RepID=UPI0029BC058C|nr:DUF4436 family protein [Microbacterium sp. LRZ72]MDX2376927.1 DUF4436 domain-containing protein [Microbacterium sp. LRZ72]
MTAPPPVPLWRRRSVRVAVLVAALFALVYAAVIVLYAQSGQVETTEDFIADPDAVLLVVEPTAVDAVADRITVSVELANAGAAGDGLAPDETLTVVLFGVDGERTIEYSPDRFSGRTSVEVITEGSVEAWPFDTHQGLIAPLAYRMVDGEPELLPTQVYAEGKVAGWNIAAQEGLMGEGGVLESEGEDADVVQPQADDEELRAVVFSADRSGSTVAFGIVLLGLMIVMPVLVLIVAVTVFIGRRRVEPDFLGWIAAMLFATIPLRTFLPDAPPIGSWIDYLIVLWVFVGLVGGLALYVAAWLRHTHAPAQPSA